MCCLSSGPGYPAVFYAPPAPEKKKKKEKKPKVEYRLWNSDEHAKLYGINGWPASQALTGTVECYYPPAPAVMMTYPYAAPKPEVKTKAIPADNDQQFWVLYPDNSYVLCKLSKINKEKWAGKWEHGSSGYPYFVRKKD